MRFKLFLFAVVSLLCLILDVVAVEKDLPDISPQEVARRGNMVEFTGTIRSGLMAAAFAPPVDDSAKWFITLIIKPGDTDSDIMKHTVESDKAVSPWINATDAAKSTTHYHVRSVEDPTQSDWLAGLRQAIAEKGLPVVVLQPPRNGQFGSSATIVKMIHGKRTGKDLADKLRESVIAYVKAIEQPSKGLSQTPESPPAAVISVAPPFTVQPITPAQPVQPSLPFDWPPSAPKALTPEEIRQAVPEADAAFILQTIDSKETNLEIVKLRYLATHPVKPPAPAPVVHDEEPEAEPVEKPFFRGGHPSAICWVAMTIAMAFGLVAAVVVKWVQRQAGNAIGIINDLKTAANQVQTQRLTQATPQPTATPTVKTVAKTAPTAPKNADDNESEPREQPPPGCRFPLVAFFAGCLVVGVLRNDPLVD